MASLLTACFFFIFLCCFHDAYSGAHSLSVLHTELAQCADFPEFHAVVMLDDTVIMNYNSDTSTVHLKHEWIAKHLTADQKELEDLSAREAHNIMKTGLNNTMRLTKSTVGPHLFQWMKKVEVNDDVLVKWDVLFRFDGKDFIRLDQQTMNWVVVRSEAQSLERQFTKEPDWRNTWRENLEHTVVVGLNDLLQKGKQFVERKSRPVVYVFDRKRPLDSSVAVSCLVTGFYPRFIEVVWQRNEDFVSGVESPGLLPNHDGTYQIKITLTLAAEDEAEYWCHVTHSSLSETQTEPWVPERSPTVRGVAIAAGILGIVAVVCVTVRICTRKKTAQDGQTQQQPALLIDVSSRPMEQPKETGGPSGQLLPQPIGV
uniref:Non-classical MHC class I antigen n=1 Tax=Squalus acanthias TaxID=7797 RepID=Q8HWI9_SQUAC|nr:non-classical MHC class I antigen [Squalus acanthias]